MKGIITALQRSHEDKVSRKRRVDMRLRRIYVNNFRGMRKFEVKFEDASDNVILGKNGVGKSTLRNILELMKAIAWRENSMVEW